MRQGKWQRHARCYHTTFNAHSQVPVRACTQRLVECLTAKPVPDEDACAACQHVRCRVKRSLCAVTNACIASYRLPRETKLQLRAFVCIYICVCTCTHRRAHGRVCLHTCMRVGDGFRLVREVWLRREAERALLSVCLTVQGKGPRACCVLEVSGSPHWLVTRCMHTCSWTWRHPALHATTDAAVLRSPKGAKVTADCLQAAARWACTRPRCMQFRSGRRHADNQ